MIRCALRIPKDFHARLAARAAADRRSINSEILSLLEVALSTPAAEAESPGDDPASPTPRPGKPDPSQA
ncbi:Arc family DNA-binding protein [Nonomuraea sp. SYSU D8015]|uniref:Arc family DNA-binding protein n=1 Tax=Nonomuraea sp. SYSU D8015 TaxID=2593644 RepID=UPI001660169C